MCARAAGVERRRVLAGGRECVEELRTAFRDSVDVHSAWCREGKEAPDKHYSGKLNIRISPDLHPKAAIKAQACGESLNDFVAKAMEDEIETEVLA